MKNIKSKYYLFLIISILIFSNNVIYGHTHNFIFDHLGVEDGLSETNVKKIIEDKNGFLWIATQSGLNRYDGYNFKVYHEIPGDTNSLIHNNITDLFIDSNDRLWVGTSEGLNIYNQKMENFKRIDIPDYNIMSITECKKNIIWIGTSNGLYKYQNNHLKKITLHLKNTINANIFKIKEFSPGKLLIGASGKYMYVFNTDTETISQSIKYPNNQLLGINNESVQKILIDSQGKTRVAIYGGGVFTLDTINYKLESFCNELTTSLKISDIIEYEPGVYIIGTDDSGVNIFNQNNKTIHYLYEDTGNPKSLSSNKISHIFTSSTGQLFICSTISDINVFSKNKYKFNLYRNQPCNPTSLPHNSVLSFFEMHDKSIWIGTEQGGVSKFMPTENTFKRFNLNKVFEADIKSQTILSIFQDSKGQIWLGTYGAGLLKFDQQKGVLKQYLHNPENTNSINSDDIWSIAEDKENGNLWLGTHAGLCYFDTQSENFIRYYANPDSLGSLYSNSIFSLHMSKNNILYIGTVGGGLNVYNKNTNSFNTFMHYPNIKGSISSNNVYHIAEDSNGNIWLATEYGVNYFKPTNESFKVLTVKDGLAHNTVNSLTFDQGGNLWIGTLNGLSKLNPQTHKFTNFTTSDGLQGREFKIGAVTKASDNTLYFGGNNGFNQFNPADISFNPIKPKIAFTKLSVNNNTVNIGDTINNKIILTKNINNTQKLVFNYARDVITIEFAALHYMAPEQNKYAYRLKGWVDNWTYTKAQNRTATYANIKPGEYVFEVVAANPDGYWNKESKQLEIEILPPWWATQVAFISYVLVFVLLIFLSRYIVKMKLDYQHSLNIEKLKNAQLAELHKKDREIDQLKLVMFTNISHEFRTPLTLITGPLENIVNKVKDVDTKDQLKIVWRNAKRLLVLINQILDVRKLELGKYNLQLEKLNVVKHIKDIHNSFLLLAQRNNIDFQLHTEPKELYTYADADVLEKVLYNLLSNAFKHTKKGGIIKIELQNTANEFILKVIDNGKGIPEDELPKVFERFYMSKRNKNNLGTSSGIGLSLSKDLIELYGGNIQVDSKEGKGTTFTIILPLFNEIPENDRYQKPLKVNLESTTVYSPDTIDVANYEENTSVYNNSDLSEEKPTLLIVEDNFDMQKYLKHQFENEYNIIVAENGEKGFEKTIVYNPDFIVSDVMMPVMNGIELCQKLKCDVRTSHIPVILLTAKQSESLQLQSLEIGADSYVNKPFNIDILKAKVKNILNTREQLREKYSNDLVNDDFTKEQNNADKVFLSKAIKVVENNLTNESFNVDIFAREVGMGRTTFYKKLKTISGYTVNDFIKIVRLKKAAHYLKYTKTSITEIYYKVGFNDGSYFASCFQKQYGMLPTQYRNEHSN